jgi:hypothetical protein
MYIQYLPEIGNSVASGTFEVELGCEAIHLPFSRNSIIRKLKRDKVLSSRGAIHHRDLVRIGGDDLYQRSRLFHPPQ